MATPRALLVLGRVSNLSTVWSNCLCAWILGGRGDWTVFTSLLVGTSLLYVGGMYLNDYCDASFDKQFRPERPIPSEQISRRAVLYATLSFLSTGYALVAWTKPEAALYGLLLVGLIVVYNLVHKKTALGIPLMAGCRLTVYLLVGGAALGGVRFDVLIAGGLMFIYVFGITSLARTESTDGAISKWGLFWVVAPIAGVLLFGFTNGLWKGPILGSLVFGGWVAITFLKAKVEDGLSIGKTIGPLLAGICLVDWAILSSMGQLSLTTGGTLLAFFVIALIAQKRIPAT